MRTLTRVALAAITVITSANFASAQLVTVDMKNVTIQDVAKELETQSGLRMQFIGGKKPLQWFIGARIAELKAEDEPVKHVLRRACEETGYKFRRINENTFWIETGEMPPRPYFARIGVYEVTVEQVTVSGQVRSLNFSEGIPRENKTAPRLTVKLVIEADTEEDAETIAGLTAIAVADNDGKETTAPEEKHQRVHFFPTPDKFSRSITFDLPSDSATEIATLIGGLKIRQSIERKSLEFNDLKKTNVPLAFEDMSAVLLEFTPPPANSPTDHNNRLNWKVKLEAQNMEHGQDKEDVWNREKIRLIGNDGKDYMANSTSGSGRNKTMTWDMRFSIPGDVEPVALSLDLARKSSQTREVEFMIRNIPLPTAE